MSALKTLEQHNQIARERFDDRERQRPNGIACPKCGAELFDTHPGTTLTTNPPKYHIGCLADGCGYAGYRL